MILAMVLIGVGLVSAAVLGYHWSCPWPRADGTVCSAIANSPPWTLLTSVGSAPALILLWLWRTNHKDQDIGIARREERSRRFLEGTKLLSSDQAQSRFGAIYSLQTLARESNEDVQCIVDTLCAFIRIRSQDMATEPQAIPELSSPAIDKAEQSEVQVALWIVVRLNAARCKIDLRGASLRGISFELGSICYADFSNADLSDANLADVDFCGTWFTGADLSRASFCRSNLSKVGFDHANLSNAIFLQTNLSGAVLTHANLTKANLCDANLSGTVLSTAILEGVVMRDACYDTQTRFPSDFDAVAAGMIPRDIAEQPELKLKV